MTKETVAAPVKPFCLRDTHITRKELAVQLSRTVSSLQGWERKRFGPSVSRVGNRPYYAISTVEAWLRAQESPYPPKSADSSNGGRR